MKYKSAILKDLEWVEQLNQNLSHGISNSMVTPQQAIDLLEKQRKLLEQMRNKLELEHDN